MAKRLLCLCAMFVCGALVGCDKGSSVASAASEAAEKAKKEAEEKVGKMKDEMTKAVDFTALDSKINSLTGDAKTAALAKFGDLRKMFDEFKASTDLTKLGEMKDKVMKAYDELKKMVGL